MSTQTGVQTVDIPRMVHDALVDMGGDGQGRRVRGYAKTQSITEIFKYLDSDDIIRMEARRRVKDKTESFGRLSLPSVTEYTDMEEQLKREFRIDYDRLEHGKFNWSEVKNIIDTEGLKDVAVTHLVYKFESQALFEKLTELLKHIGLYDSTFFNQPFHAELSSKPPGHSNARQQVRDYNDEILFKRMGWKVRTLDLEAIWSLDAWKNAENQRKIEEHAFNHIPDGIPQYGAVESPLVYGAWKNSLNPGVVDHKEWELTEEETWEQVR